MPCSKWPISLKVSSNPKSLFPSPIAPAYRLLKLLPMPGIHDKHFIYTRELHSFLPAALLSQSPHPSYRWENWGSACLSKCSKAAHPTGGRAGLQTQSSALVGSRASALTCQSAVWPGHFLGSPQWAGQKALQNSSAFLAQQEQQTWPKHDSDAEWKSVSSDYVDKWENRQESPQPLASSGDGPGLLAGSNYPLPTASWDAREQMNIPSWERKASLPWKEDGLSRKRGNLSIPGILTHNPSRSPYVCAPFPSRKLFSPSEEGKDPVEEVLGREKTSWRTRPSLTLHAHQDMKQVTYCFWDSWCTASGLETPGLCFSLSVPAPGPSPAPSPDSGPGPDPSPGPIPGPGHLRKPDIPEVNTKCSDMCVLPSCAHIPLGKGTLSLLLPWWKGSHNEVSRLLSMIWAFLITLDLEHHFWRLCSSGTYCKASSKGWFRG